MYLYAALSLKKEPDESCNPAQLEATRRWASTVYAIARQEMVNYARVSSHDQKQDPIGQVQVLEAFSATNGWQFETIQDLGSGLNYKKKGLQKLLKRIMRGDVGRLVLTHKDRMHAFRR